MTQQPNEKQIRVLLVDDDPLVRMGLTGILTTDPRIVIAGEAGDGAECLTFLRTSAVDVILMDIRMPNINGIEATKQIRTLPNPPPIVVLTTFSADDNVLAALEAGASGFLLKDTDPARILDAIHTANAGDALIDPAVTRTLIDHVTATSPTAESMRLRIAAARITPAEREILTRLADGASNQQIAGSLRISESAVKAHINRMYPKLGVENRVQAAIFAHKAGIA